jgi:ribonuclease HI
MPIPLNKITLAIEWCKVNIDGSFGANGDAGCGVVVTDHDGTIWLFACRQLSSCRDALEAELYAVLEGLSLALH